MSHPTSMTSTGQFNCSLIDAYEKCPILYDCDHPDYKAPGPTNESWTYVAAQCGGANPQDCRVRWKALRDRYIKERKRRLLGKCDPAKKYWPLYDRMDFLDEYVEKQRRKYPKNGLTKENQIRLAKGEIDSKTLKEFSDGGTKEGNAIYAMLGAELISDTGIDGIDLAGEDDKCRDENAFFSGVTGKLLKAMGHANAGSNDSSLYNILNNNRLNKDSDENSLHEEEDEEEESTSELLKEPREFEEGDSKEAATAAAVDRHFANAAAAVCGDFNLDAFVGAVTAVAANVASSAAVDPSTTPTSTSAIGNALVSSSGGAATFEIDRVKIARTSDANDIETSDLSNYADEYLRTYGRRVLGAVAKNGRQTTPRSRIYSYGSRKRASVSSATLMDAAHTPISAASMLSSHGASNTAPPAKMLFTAARRQHSANGTLTPNFSDIATSSLDRDAVDALRLGAENLARCTQVMLDRDAEASFGDFVASMLRAMKPDERNLARAKIFALLNTNGI